MEHCPWNMDFEKNRKGTNADIVLHCVNNHQTCHNRSCIKAICGGVVKTATTLVDTRKHKFKGSSTTLATHWLNFMKRSLRHRPPPTNVATPAICPRGNGTDSQTAPSLRPHHRPKSTSTHEGPPSYAEAAEFRV